MTGAKITGAKITGANMISCQRHLFSIPPEIAYFNTAYMSPLLTSVVQAIDHGVRMKATPWAVAIPDFYDTVDRARRLFAGLMNADAQGVAVVPSASYAIETAAKNLTVGPGKRVVVLANQFPSHLYPWRRLVREQGGEIATVAAPSDGDMTKAVLAAIDQRCAVAALPNVLWTNGAVIDLVAVRAACDQVGAALVLDLTQSAGAMKTDFTAIRPDFAAVACYKWMMGPYATGFLYAAPHRRNGTPLEEGWISRKDSRDFAGLVNYTDAYEPGATRYDMGERSNFALMPGVVAALEQLTDWGIGAIDATLASHNRALSQRLTALGLTPTPDALRGPHFIGASLPATAPPDLLQRLAAQGIYLSERGGSLRITPHLWNTIEDFDRLIAALAAML